MVAAPAAALPTVVSVLPTPLPAAIALAPSPSPTLSISDKAETATPIPTREDTPVVFVAQAKPATAAAETTEQVAAGGSQSTSLALVIGGSLVGFAALLAAVLLFLRVAKVVGMRFRRPPGPLPALCLACAVVLLVVAAAGCGSAKPPSGVTAVKLGVDADATYQVTAASLREVGFDLAAGPRDEVVLSAGGQPVPFEWVGEGAGLGIRFKGLRLAPDSYTPRNVYWLKREQGASSPKPAEGPRPTATAPSATGAVTATVRLEEALRYDPQARKPDERWYWQALFAPAKAEISFDAPGVEAAPAELQVYLVAKSSAPVDPDHRVLVSLNGKLVADAPWDGMVPHLVTASIPSGLLKPDGQSTRRPGPRRHRGAGGHGPAALGGDRVSAHARRQRPPFARRSRSRRRRAAPCPIGRAARTW